MDTNVCKKHLEVILNAPQEDNPSALREAILGLDAFFKNHKHQMDKDLAHYLSKRSYQKAWDFLQKLSV